MVEGLFVSFMTSKEIRKQFFNVVSFINDRSANNYMSGPLSINFKINLSSFSR
jgi:hypothetical protein